MNIEKEMNITKPWHNNLSIGSYIKIPISSFVKVTKKPKKKQNAETSQPRIPKTRRILAYFDENKCEVDSSDVYKGYKIGNTIIPSFDNDKSELYQPGFSSLHLYGFTSASNIHWQHLSGCYLYYLFGREGDKKAQQAITCLTEILHENKLVGIARRVYNNGNAPVMFVLMPVIDVNNYAYLSMTSLWYKEEIKYLSFPPTNIRKYTCTKDQVNAFKDLIEAMDMNDTSERTIDDTKEVPINEMFSSSAQNLLDRIAFQALNPDGQLPQSTSNTIKLSDSYQEVSKRVKDIFLLEKIEPKHKKQTKVFLKSNSSDQSLPEIKTEKEDRNYNISTIDPIRDVLALMNNGKTLMDLALEITEVIQNLLYFNLDGIYTKALNTMTYFRNECVKTDPTIYNNWLVKYKVDLGNRNRYDIQKLITEKGVDIILKSENTLSTFETIDSHEENQICEADTVPKSTEIFINQDINDMFDEI